MVNRGKYPAQVTSLDKNAGHTNMRHLSSCCRPGRAPKQGQGQHQRDHQGKAQQQKRGRLGVEQAEFAANKAAGPKHYKSAGHKS